MTLTIEKTTRPGKKTATATDTENLVPNTPNAARTIEALRYLDYDPYSAIEDIGDNSLDAGADNIWISVDEVGDDVVIAVADDGTGMTQSVLDEALKLGSITPRDERADLGKFGMGLVTASLAVARRTTVYTRKSGGPTVVSVTDVDQIVGRDEFVKVLREATPADEARFGSFFPDAKAPEHGTAVVLDHCDNLGKVALKTFRSTLRKRLAETYRNFIAGPKGRKIYLDGKIEPFDPLMWDHPETDRHSDETYKIELQDGDGPAFEGELKVRIAVLPDFPDAKAKGITQNRQGIYVLRNNRQIADAITFGLFSKHDEFNRIRAEVLFDATLDKFMGVRFTKQNVDPVQAIRDKIREEVVSEIRTIGRKLRQARREKSTDGAEKVHEAAAKKITSKGPLLVKPGVDAPEQTLLDQDGATAAAGEPATTAGVGADGKSAKRPLLKDLCEFKTVHRGPHGLIFDWDKVGKTVVVSWNADHPFYEHFVLKTGEEDVVTGVDFLGYSIAAAILKMDAEDNRAMLEEIMTIISSNMRVLLS